MQKNLRTDLNKQQHLGANNDLDEENVILYERCGYWGWNVALKPGEYTINKLLALGMVSILHSIKVPSKMKIIIFSGANFNGSNKTFTSNDICLRDNGWNGQIESIKVICKNLSRCTRGQKGETGPQGPKGTDGKQGIPGKNGTRGIRG